MTVHQAVGAKLAFAMPAKSPEIVNWSLSRTVFKIPSRNDSLLFAKRGNILTNNLVNESIWSNPIWTIYKHFKQEILLFSINSFYKCNNKWFHKRKNKNQSQIKGKCYEFIIFGCIEFIRFCLLTDILIGLWSESKITFP